MKIILIGLFGMVGVYTRYFIGQLNRASFLNSTLLVNIIGCFVIGLCYKNFNSSDSNKVILSAVAIGFCGGLTTFSTFILDSFKYIENNQFMTMTSYLLGSVILGMLALYVGVKINS